MKESLKIIPEAFFDIIAYLIPGCFFIVFILLDSNFLTCQIIEHNNPFYQMLIIVFAGYIAGHIITSISQLILVMPINYFFGNPTHTLIGLKDGKFLRFQTRLSDDLISKISSVIVKNFQTEIDKHTFFLCENYIRINYPDIGFFIRKRHALEHMCRNIALACLILLFILATDVFDMLLCSILVISIIRYLDYRISWPKVVYESFFLTASADPLLQKSNNTKT